MKETQKPPLRLLFYWQIRTLLICLIPSVLVSLTFPLGSFYWRICTALWIFVGAAFVFVYYPIRYLKCSYHLQEAALVVRSGVIYSRTHTLPLHNIQLVNVVATPLLQLFGLRGLTVYAPGASVHIPGLLPQQAVELGDALLAQGGAL